MAMAPCNESNNDHTRQQGAGQETALRGSTNANCHRCASSHSCHYVSLTCSTASARCSSPQVRRLPCGAAQSSSATKPPLCMWPQVAQSFRLIYRSKYSAAEWWPDACLEGWRGRQLPQRLRSAPGHNLPCLRHQPGPQLRAQTLKTKQTFSANIHDPAPSGYWALCSCTASAAQ